MNNLIKYIRSRSKKTKTLSFKDIGYLHSLCQDLYKDLLLEKGVMHYANPSLWTNLVDYRNRSWEINGPALLDKSDSYIYMYVINYDKLDFTEDFMSNPPPYFSMCGAVDNLQPTGTCFKIRVDYYV